MKELKSKLEPFYEEREKILEVIQEAEKAGDKDSQKQMDNTFRKLCDIDVKVNYPLYQLTA